MDNVLKGSCSQTPGMEQELSTTIPDHRHEARDHHDVEEVTGFAKV